MTFEQTFQLQIGWFTLIGRTLGTGANKNIERVRTQGFFIVKFVCFTGFNVNDAFIHITHKSILSVR